MKEGASRSVLRGIIQNDTLNEVNIRLTDGSKAFDYTGYTNIVFKVLKADGTSYIDSEGDNVIATAPMDGIVTVHLKGQATTAAGLCQSVIEIYSVDGKMTTARFNYEVFETLDTAEATESESQYPVFQNLLSDLAGIEAAEAARVAAEAARASFASGYVAQAQKAAAEAEMWAQATRNMVEGDFATVTELGAATSTKAIADWDEARTNGWYSGAAGASNSPDSRYTWFGRVICYTKDILMQEVWGLIDTTVYRHCVRLVYPNGGTPWEWVNPPMLFNIEYRTTERHLSRPVYVKMLPFDALPTDGTVVKLPITENEAIFHAWVAYIVCANSSGINKFPTGADAPSVEITADNYDNTNAYVKISNKSNLSGFSGTVTVKYTKSNDT